MVRFLTTVLVFILSFSVLAAPAPKPSPVPEKIQVARRVLEIFEDKCIDCHGPELRKPKGKFGYVLDLTRVAANADYITPGKPEESEIYHMVVTNEMPGKDSKVLPLTPAELAVVKRWIELGAPGETALAQPSPPPPVVEESVAPPPFFKRTLIWLGQFHAMSTHFPVALLLVAVVAELMALLTKRPSWLETVRFLVILGALGALASATLGWMNGVHSSYGVGKSAWVYQTHKWLGTFTALWAVTCAVLVCRAPCEEGSPERAQFRGALLFGAALVSAVGFLGGALVFGLDHYVW